MEHSLPKRQTRQRLGTAFLAGLLAAAGIVTQAAAAPPGPMPFGAYDPAGDFSADTELTIEHLFLPWEDVALSSLTDADAYAVARNRALVLTIEPWTWTRDERNTPEFLRRGIREGYYDANMRGICDVAATLQSPVTIRWGHEMDEANDQFIWSGWDPKDYIESFRRVIDICRKAAPRINVMWSPLGDDQMAKYYPGDDYVDLVGLSVFGLQAYDRIVNDDKDRSFTDILGPRYARAAAFGKPVVVAELGYSGEAAYVAAWESEVRKARPEYPNLVGVVYFNQPEVYPWPENLGLPDWRINERVIAAPGQ